MKALWAISLLFLSAATEARVLDLRGDCTVPSGFAPSATQPFQLDWCNPVDRDEISQLLVQVAAQWPGSVSIVAPTTSMSLTSNTVQWGSQVAVREFRFLESPTAATLRVLHPSNATDKYRMWVFANLNRVIIGGPGLKVTFVGTHPGLGTGDNTQAGLIELKTNDGSSPALADIRANFANSQSHGVHFLGASNGVDGEATQNRFQQVNVAGRFVNSGIVINSGVRDVWFDPNNLRVMDPFVRGQGWDGALAGTRPDGIKVGCFDTARYQYRSFPGAQAQYVRRVSGGVTFEYGAPVANIFVAKYIGDGPEQPYRVRFKDFGFSGPTSITGLPAGVMVKKAIDTTVMKHDPLPPFGHTAADFRYLMFEELPSTYGNGLESGPISGGCAAGNATDNNMHTGTPYIWRAEASRDEVAAQYVTSYVDVTFKNISKWQEMGDARAYIQASGSGADIAPGPSVPDRTFGHVLRAAAGTLVPGTTQMLDNNTLTGPGSWFRPSAAPVRTDQGTVINPIGNRILDTSIHGNVEIGANAKGTVIRNVNFSGAARPIIHVGSGSDVVVDAICAPSGSTITGQGSVTYQGRLVPLPYTISSASQCTLAQSPRPLPPENLAIR